MQIIRKSGPNKEFSVEELQNSLANASDEANEPLPMSDIKMLTSSLLEILGERDEIPSYYIPIVITGLLYTKGYYGVIDKYLTYVRKRV